jgi:hypothetical protein
VLLDDEVLGSYGQVLWLQCYCSTVDSIDDNISGEEQQGFHVQSK